ncbi:hypothetical protein AWENTII_010996 [Aspergillus wentii]
MLPTVQLGANGPRVSAQGEISSHVFWTAADVLLGLGLMGLCMFYGFPLANEDRLQFLDTAHARGVTFWDAVDVYADNEDILATYVLEAFQ